MKGECTLSHRGSDEDKKTDKHTSSTKRLLPQSQPDHIGWLSMSPSLHTPQGTESASTFHCSTWDHRRWLPLLAPLLEMLSPQALQGEDLRPGPNASDEIPSPK